MRRRGLAPAAAAVSVARARVAPVPARDVPWLLLLPTVALAAAAIGLLAAPLGDALLAPAELDYWQTYAIVEKPATQAGYVLFCLASAAYAGAVAWAVRRPLRMEPEAARVVVVTTQLIGLAFLLACWIAQHGVSSLGATRTYFTPATLVAAAAIAGVVVVMSRRADLAPGTANRTCLLAAVLLTVVWLLPSIYTDRGVAAGPPEIFVVNGFVFDEAHALLNGRTPLVDLATYGALWPYATTLPFGALGGSFAAFTTLLTAITALSLLAIHGVLRRIVTQPLAALALYLPFLATSLFVQAGTGVARFTPGNYFGVFPLRYAGPYLLAWLTARWLAAPAPSWRATVGLFACAGLVACNNLDFGVSALGAGAVALVAARPPRSRAELLRLAGQSAGGLAVAVVLVTTLTLLRSGSLPDPSWLLRYGRVFSSGGWGNLALPGLGFHLAVTATFVAALTTAAVRAASATGRGGSDGASEALGASPAGASAVPDASPRGPACANEASGAVRERVLTGMLAWAGVFGLGASVYYYAYRSHPDVLINLFSAWALALALLTVVAVRSLRDADRRPSLPALAVLFGFGLAACSLAQLPLPWQQLDRIATDAGSEPYREAAVTARVEQLTQPGEPVLIFLSLGHRVAHEAGVVNLSPYTGLMQMPTREQLHEAIDLLVQAGGRQILLAEEPWPGMAGELRRAGFARQPAAPGDPVVAWTRPTASASP